MNYEMLVIPLKVDKIIIYSKVFSRTRIISPEILPLVSSKKLSAIYVPSGRALVLCSTVVIVDSYNDSRVFLQSMSVYSMKFCSLCRVVDFIDLLYSFSSA